MPPRNVDIDPASLVDGSDPFPSVQPVVTAETHEEKRPPMRIVWRNVILMSYLHIAALYGVYCLFYCKFTTIIFAVAYYIMSGWGITAGAHRLWAHKSFKAKLPFRIVLAIWNSMAFQNDVIEWARDHRVHHKFSETNADPHNAKRGFFFAHVGWLLVRKHPEVSQKGKDLDMNDLYCDPILVIQRKIYLPSVLLMCFIVPTVVPWYYWGENVWNAFFIVAILRYAATLNATWLVNSAAHMWGNRPYDKFINPSENLLVSLGAQGEGFHNYHHTYPFDYSTSEFGWKINITTMLIDFMALIGQVYDRKKPSEETIRKRRMRTGDGSHTFAIIGQSYTEDNDKSD